MIKLVQITKHSLSEYRLTNIFVNPEHIIFMSEHLGMKNDLNEGKIKIGINTQATFTKIKINENSGFSEIVVVGSPESIQGKISSTKQRRILKG